MRTFRRYSLSMAALLGSVPLEEIDCRGVSPPGDLDSIKLTRESRGDGEGGGALFSAAFSRLSSSERCYSK